MSVIILSIYVTLIVLIIILINIFSYLKKKKQEKRQKQEEENRIFAEREKQRIEKERKEAEQKRLEELKYEKLTVVFATINKNNEPEAIVKRIDDTYAFIHRCVENAPPYVVDEILKLKREQTERCNWCDVGEYQKQLSKFQEFERKNNQFLDRFGIQYLYHMTHINNLDSILEKGLQSHNYAQDKKLTKNNIANNQVNNRRSRLEPIFEKSIHDYVPLYFNPKNPMLYVRKNIQKNIVILAIDRKILFRENTIFTDGNAASNRTQFYKNVIDLDKLNWNCITFDYWNVFNDGKRQRCSEVLVYREIPTYAIQKIFCNNQEIKELVNEELENYPNIKAEVNTNLYFNTNFDNYPKFWD